MKKSLSIIVPIYNEELRLQDFFKKIEILTNHLNNFLFIEIIFVDDGSNDNSINLIKKFKIEKIKKIIIQEKHVGMMNAIFSGIKNASSNNVMTIEADMPVPIDESIKKFNYFIDNNFDLLIGSRYLAKIPKKMPLIRKFISKSYLYLFNNYFKINISDPQIGFKILKKNKFEEIYQYINLKYDGLKSSQLVILFYMFGLNIAEKSVDYEYKDNSKNFNFKNFSNVIFINLKAFIDFINKIKKLKLEKNFLKNPIK